jgi:hypothetical protein
VILAFFVGSLSGNALPCEGVPQSWAGTDPSAIDALERMGFTGARWNKMLSTLAGTRLGAGLFASPDCGFMICDTLRICCVGSGAEITHLNYPGVTLAGTVLARLFAGRRSV